MGKHKMVQTNLVKNSISAYFSAIEIHNKPNISYRYETVSLLIMNSWELILKAYVRKYIKNKSIYENNGHTIRFDKALGYVKDDINSKKKNSFTAVAKNLEQIEKFRNQITHYYCEELEPFIFMLISKAALNYVEFVKKYFGKDIMQEEGLFIMPLGFKLPFRPEDFLSNNVAKYDSSEYARDFISGIVNVIRELDTEGIDDSIVLGFDMYINSVKNVANKTILAAITDCESAEVIFGKNTNFKISNDSNNVLNVRDDEYKNIWKYTHAELVLWCKNNIKNFKQGELFNAAKKAIENNQNYVYQRRLDNDSIKSQSKKYYSEEGLKAIKSYYEKYDNNITLEIIDNKIGG